MKRIDFETLSTVFEFCRDKCNLDVDSGCPVADCPIWQGLEDVGEEPINGATNEIQSNASEWLEPTPPQLRQEFGPAPKPHEEGSQTPDMCEVGQCDNCGQGLYHETEEMFDGTTLICGDCKTIHWFSCDEDGGFINTEGEIQTPDDPDVYRDGGEDK
jgi:hypothetical protein